MQGCRICMKPQAVYLTGGMGMGMDIVVGKVLKLASQAGSSSFESAATALANCAMPFRSWLACLCSLLPASRDSSCIT